MSNEIELTGPDGSNPLGFMAAIGLLRWLTQEDPERHRAITLHWRDDGVWIPILRGVDNIDAVISRIVADAPTWLHSAALNLSYPKKEKNKTRTAYDLKPRPEIYRDWLRSFPLNQARATEFAAAYGVAEVTDNNGNVKPTAFHFTAGPQDFLVPPREIADALTWGHVHNALFGPWREPSGLKDLRWDSIRGRAYALRARSPDSNKGVSRGTPGADWLAFQALPLFPVAARGRRLHTACTGGNARRGYFRWPVWTVPAQLPSVRALLTQLGVERLTAAQRHVRGIGQVFACDIRRSSHGYGTFGPARIASADDRVGS